MGDLSVNFSRSEFACNCGCGFATADIKLVYLLESIRERFKKPVRISSASRCTDYNQHVGGVKTSKHLQGIACDIQIKGVKPYDIYKFVDSYSPNNYGIGLYSTFTHIDVRKNKSRWKG
jgi:uncharacterized protein YcbK (DUF882 family)|tara:strand:+ start:171 stop:527 length:357 start_codon:yes stop_codon:yes gene_type:complete